MVVVFLNKEVALWIYDIIYHIEKDVSDKN